MWQMILTWFRGIRLLRHPVLVRDLGERLRRLREIEAIRIRFPQSTLSDGVVLAGYREGSLDLAPSAGIAQGSILAFGSESNGFGAIRIGGGSWVGEYNNLRACGGGNIVIGTDCLVSQFCTLVAGNHSAAAERPIIEQGVDPRRLGVTLNDDVWLGAGTTILPGVVVGRGAVIGANSVVNCDIPPYEIWAGSPARRIGNRQERPPGVVEAAVNKA
jgi:acetyltransferase-like isoleucine patch superfamily enzyme